jgi:hypothetical protein
MLATDQKSLPPRESQSPGGKGGIVPERGGVNQVLVQIVALPIDIVIGIQKDF